jgi:hypothetical protein
MAWRMGTSMVGETKEGGKKEREKRNRPRALL